MSGPRHALGLLATVVAFGCAGSRGEVRVDTARSPVSLSPVLLDRDGTPLYLGEDLSSRGELHLERKSYGTLYGAVGRDVEIGDAINQEVSAKGGVGVVNLKIEGRNCGLNWVFPLTVLPFWPGCQKFEITGTVVSRKDSRETPSDAVREASP